MTTLTMRLQFHNNLLTFCTLACLQKKNVNETIYSTKHHLFNHLFHNFYITINAHIKTLRLHTHRPARRVGPRNRRVPRLTVLLRPFGGGDLGGPAIAHRYPRSGGRRVKGEGGEGGAVGGENPPGGALCCVFVGCLVEDGVWVGGLLESAPWGNRKNHMRMYLVFNLFKNRFKVNKK